MKITELFREVHVLDIELTGEELEKLLIDAFTQKFVIEPGHILDKSPFAFKQNAKYTFSLKKSQVKKEAEPEQKDSTKTIREIPTLSVEDYIKNGCYWVSVQNYLPKNDRDVFIRVIDTKKGILKDLFNHYYYDNKIKKWYKRRISAGDLEYSIKNCLISFWRYEMSTE